MEKKLYPLRFVPIASRRPWGGTSLRNTLSKTFTETDTDGRETEIPASELIGESWELADMGEQDSAVAEGYLAGNTISDLMQVYMERIVGEKVFDWYGLQFPLLIKFLDIEGRLSVQVHPDDKVAMERYDSLGKAEVWYILDAKPDAKIYMGFNRDVTAQEFYDACKKGTADALLNVIHPKKGDVIYIEPGTVHAAEGGILVCEIQESSDMTFRLYDWGREFNPATARKMHLDEAIDLIDFSRYDCSDYTPASSRKSGDFIVADCPHFTVRHLELNGDLSVDKEDGEGFTVYSCIAGEVSLQAGDGTGSVKDYRLHTGDTVLIPDECRSYTLSPVVKGSELLEGRTIPAESVDTYTGEKETPENQND